jgi:hypothetical protein
VWGGGGVDGDRGALLLIFDHHIDGVLCIGSLDLKPFGESYIKYTTLSHGFKCVKEHDVKKIVTLKFLE